MDPSINNTGIRKLPTPLDLAGLVDVGWNLIPQQARVSGSHTYSDNGRFPVSVILAGGRAGERAANIASIDVGNVSPSLASRNNLTGQVNVPVNMVDLGEFQDPGFGPTETFQSYIDWGDGSPAESGQATIDRPGSAGILTLGSFDGSHTYSQIGSYQVLVRVVDDDGGYADRTFTIQVNAPPEIKLSLDRSQMSEAARPGCGQPSD